MRRLLFVIVLIVSALHAAQSRAQINKDYFYYMGRNYLVDNNYQEAIRILNALIRVDSGAYEAYYLRGIAKYNLDDLLGADRDFSAAIEKNPVHTMAYNNRAITRARLGNYDDALKDFAEVIALRPDLPGTFFSRGVTYFQTQQYRAAIDDFNEFIKRDDKVTDAYINRGTCYLFVGDTVRAMADFDRAVRNNVFDPQAYNRRGSLYLQKNEYDKAMEDFDHAISLDSTYVHAYFNRAIASVNMLRPLEAIRDFSKVIELDPNNALTYFNRALTRSQIGDYNNALEDYDIVARFAPNNVLVYFNRAAVKSRLGDLEAAVADYTKSIELYPDFANAYLNRSNLRAMLGDSRGARQDRNTANEKIAQYRSRLDDSTFAIYADTSRVFSQLLSFNDKLSATDLQQGQAEEVQIAMLPMFRFTLVERADSSNVGMARRAYYSGRLDEFLAELDNPHIVLTMRDTDFSPDSVVALDRLAEERLRENRSDWMAAFERALTQGLMKQYTNSVNMYGEAIEKNPANPFLYMNRSAVRSEMIDFVSSISDSYRRITLSNDPDGIINSSPKRVYNYDDAIADLNKALKLCPELPYIYYNRASLYVLSGHLPEAYEDYTKAIELYPDFAEAYFNRGLVQIYMKDTRKGCLDVSKAGELGIKEAYRVLRRYAPQD